MCQNETKRKEMIMKVLSLFDGISCGMVALERAGIKVDRYVAYEIEPNAIKISKKNYPQIEHCGDVTTADFSQYKGFDLILAGFPCQDLSINKANREGLKGKRSGLFWQLVRAINEVQPKYFLVENNYKMPEEDLKTITQTLGVEPILINSAEVSAQQRNRYYWTTIPNIVQPKNKGVVIADIVERVQRESLTSETVFNGKEKIKERQDKPLRIGTIGKGGQGERVYSIYGKSVTLTANGGGRGAKTGLYLIDDAVRRLTPIESERVQTLPDNYTDIEGVGETNRIKCIGNGWTVDVIVHILRGIKE
jgi:DNA (cytosine-5)-methyltransferase 3A